MRCFSSVRPDIPSHRAASGVRRYRGGRPARGSGMLVLHRSREAAKARLSRCRSTSARSRGLGMVEDRVAETDQGLTYRSVQTAYLKKLAIASRNKTAARPKQAAQLAAIRMIRPDS